MQPLPNDKSGLEVIRLVFASGEHEVRAALGQLKQRLAPVDLGVADQGTIELVLGEVLNNVVEHAYGPGRAGKIRLNCRVRAGGLSCCVCDAGRAHQGLRLPEGKPPNLQCELEDIPEGGFGWFLVRSLATRLRYSRRGECNYFRFDIPLGQGGDKAMVGADSQSDRHTG